LYQNPLMSPSPDDFVASAPFVLPDAPAEPDLVAKYFRGLGDATRVRILELLQTQGELSVGDLVEQLGQTQPKISNHLACLRWCGFVETRREHPSVYYRIADPRVAELLALGRALLEDNAEHVAACRRIDSKPC
jgi:DNA-binding transcriptional ArsR family regulator